MDPGREQIYRTHHERFIWSHFGMVVLGLWLLMSPESFGYLHSVFRKSDWISGLLLVFFGLISTSFRFRYWIWGGAFVGLWLQFAPLIFWAELPVIYVTDTLIGILAIALCVLTPFRPTELELGPQIPPGWTYNPSSWHQRIPVIFFATIAWFLSRYLAAYQLHYSSAVFDPFFGLGSEKVITSMISQEFPVSDAGLGALVYSLEAIMGAKGGVRRWHTMPWIVVIFGFLVVPAGFVSIMLVMLQPIAVGAWCGVCLIIAVCMLIMLALTVDEVVAVGQYLHASVREGKSFWKTLFQGSNYTETGVDTRTPSFHVSPLKFIRASLWGITLPWNLVLTAIIGIWLLFSAKTFGFTGEMADNQAVMGALIATLSIISFAEVARTVRLINILIAIWLALAPWFLLSSGLGAAHWHNLIIALAVILLSIFRGPIKERYGTWDKVIV